MAVLELLVHNSVNTGVSCEDGAVSCTGLTCTDCSSTGVKVKIITVVEWSGNSAAS